MKRRAFAAVLAIVLAISGVAAFSANHAAADPGKNGYIDRVIRQEAVNTTHGTQVYGRNIATDAATGRVISDSETPKRQMVAKAITPATTCDFSGHLLWFSNIGNYTPATYQYRGELYCGTGAGLATGTLSVYLVKGVPGTDYSYTEIPGTRQSVWCHAWSTCNTDFYSWTATSSNRVWKISAVAEWQNVSNFPTTYSPINNRGVSYPFYRAPWGSVDFPDYTPYTPAARGSQSQFRTACENYYTSRGYQKPPTYDAHHIKPVSVGGTGNTYNCVLIPRDPDHNRYTSWFAGATFPAGSDAVDDDAV